MYKIILGTVIVGGIGYTALFFYQPKQEEVQVVQKVHELVEEVKSIESPVEQARKELEAANKRLEEEEARVLEEMQRATSTAATEIAAIEARRDAEMEKLEAEISKINEVRSFK